MSKTNPCLQLETNTALFWSLLKERLNQAYECLYKLGYKKTIPSLKQKGASPDDADDMFHEGITAFFIQIETLNPVAAPTTVLFKISVNKWIDKLRSNSSKNIKFELEHIEYLDTTTDSLVNMINQETQAELLEALDQLDEDQKTVLEKVIFEEKKPEEVATELGVEPKWVYNQKYRALAKLRQWMKGGKKS